MVLLEPSYVENALDRLLLCAFNEAAGVDYNNVSLGLLGSYLVSRICNLVKHDLCVELVLRTAQRNESNLHIFPL